MNMEYNEENQESTYIRGTIKAIFFNNPSNYFYVLLIDIDETNTSYLDEEIVVTGNFGHVQEEEDYTFYGSLVTHPRYGLQFKADRYAKEAPKTSNGIIAYLSSPDFKGVGEKTAEKIVDHLGMNAVEKIIESPEILKDIAGVSHKQYESIKETLMENEGMQRAIVLLNQLGLTNQLAYRVYDLYKEETIENIKENPYRLAIDVEGIGFGRADSIAESLEIAADAPQRIQAAILSVLSELTMSSGDTYVRRDDLLKATVNILEKTRRFIIEPELVAEHIYFLSHTSLMIEEDERYYLPSLYASEWGIATEIERLTKQDAALYSEEEILDLLDDLEQTEGITYGPSQKQAIIEALKSPLFILTGGPGTGKTTVINAIVHIFAELNDLTLDERDYIGDVYPFKLAAPTGRAAKRMNEMTDMPASTIHRLLGLTAEDNLLDEETEQNQLSGNLLIIDEMSMVDTWLAYQLLLAVPRGMKVILVGDQDQLPSVGPGQVLRDLIDSKKIPQMELTDIYRQGEDSTIIPLAHDIKNGQLPNDLLQKHADRNFFPSSAQQIPALIENIVQKAVDKGYSAMDIQVLAPMYRGVAGIDQLNETLQDIFNPMSPGRKEVKFIDQMFRVGDKVLHLVNDAENNVYNGDIGIITGISPASDNDEKTDQLIIDFDGNEISLMRSDWNHLTLAYCCSIHKAQGSEYPIVILPLVSYYRRMLKRDLLYTAVTRVSQSLILCGEPNAFSECVKGIDPKRLTTLTERIIHEESDAFEDTMHDKSEDLGTETELLSDSGGKTDEWILTPELVEKQLIDPLIGVEELSPYNL